MSPARHSRVPTLVSLTLLLSVVGFGAFRLLGRSQVHRTVSDELPSDPVPSRLATEGNHSGRSVAEPLRPDRQGDRAGIAADRSAERIVRDVRRLTLARIVEGRPVEAQINGMHQYLVGVVETVRAIDPAIFKAMGEQYAHDICSGRNTSDQELMVFARLATLQAEVGSDRALDCSLKLRAKEDIVMWALLDAWNNAGRPPLPALATIERNVADERTRSRLATPKEQSERAADFALHSMNRERPPGMPERRPADHP